MTTILDRFVTVFDFKTNTGRLNRLERRINKIQGKLDTMARGAGIAGAALTAGAGFAVRGFARYETELAKIEGLVGISRQQLAAWQDDIEEIGKATGKSPVELAKALFFVTSAGFKGSAALDILTFSAKASQAGLGETEVVADLLTSTLGVYRDGSIDAKSATDQLTAAIREGKLEPRTLARSLATVLPFAETVGVEFGEVAGAMAAMSRQGIPAERSATSLRGIFTKLIKPTEMGKKALKEVGLSIDDVRKTVREKGLLQGLRSLATAFDGNSDSLAQVFEDSEAILGVLSLTGPAALENAGIIDRVTKAHGDLDKAIKPVTKTLEDQWARTVSNAGFVVKDLGERLKPVAERLLEIANRALEFYDGLGDGPKDFLATVLSLGPPLLGAVVGLKFAKFFLGGLTPLLAGGTKAMGLFAGGLKAIAGAAAANPLLALILGLVALWIYWDEVTAAMDWAGKKFLELMRKWGVPIDDIFAWIGDAWDAAIDWIDTPLAWIFNWLADGIEGVFDWVEDAWTGVLDWFDGPGQDESVWSWLGEGIAGPFRWVFTSWAGALDWLSAPARGVFAWLGVPLDNIFGWLEAGWNDALDWLQGPGADQSVFDWLLQGVTGPFLWIYSAWADVTSWISAPFEGVWDWLSDPVDSPFEWVSEAWDKVMKGLTDLIPERLRRFLGIDAEAAEPPDEEAAGFAIPQTLGEGVESGEPGFLGKTEAALKRLRDRLPFSDAKVGPLSDLTASGRSIMSTIAEGIRQGGPAAAHALDDVLRFEALQRLDAPLPVGPAPAAIQALQTEARGEAALAAPSTVTLQIDKIEVVVPSGDPHEIAATLADELRDQLRRATEDADSKRIV